MARVCARAAEFEAVAVAGKVRHVPKIRAVVKRPAVLERDRVGVVVVTIPAVVGVVKSAAAAEDVAGAAAGFGAEAVAVIAAAGGIEVPVGVAIENQRVGRPDARAAENETVVAAIMDDAALDDGAAARDENPAVRPVLHLDAFDVPVILPRIERLGRAGGHRGKIPNRKFARIRPELDGISRRAGPAGFDLRAERVVSAAYVDRVARRKRGKRHRLLRRGEWRAGAGAGIGIVAVCRNVEGRGVEVRREVAG